MFSDIQNIRSASEPLKTEAVDSRLNNRKNRDESSQSSKHSDNASSERLEGETLPPDGNSVNRFSLDSLIYYLEDFLEENMTLPTAQQSDEQETALEVSTISPWLRSKHANLNPQRSPSLSPKRRNTIPPRYAAHAYAHRALSNGVLRPAQRRAKQLGGETEFLPKSHGPEKEAKINDVYNLIRNLRAMKKQGSTHLDVKNNAALLEGISAAVRKNTLL